MGFREDTEEAGANHISECEGCPSHGSKTPHDPRVGHRHITCRALAIRASKGARRDIAEAVGADRVGANEQGEEEKQQGVEAQRKHAPQQRAQLELPYTGERRRKQGDGHLEFGMFNPHKTLVTVFSPSAPTNDTGAGLAPLESPRRPLFEYLHPMCSTQPLVTVFRQIAQYHDAGAEVVPLEPSQRPLSEYP